MKAPLEGDAPAKPRVRTPRTKPLPPAREVIVPVGARKVVIVNETPRWTDLAAEMTRLGLQLGVNDLTQEWDIEPAEVVISKTMITGAMNFYVREVMPAIVGQNVLGFHRKLPTGEIQGFISAARSWPATRSPFGFIIRGTVGSSTTPAKPEIITPNSLTEVISHEVFETLVDPDLNFYKTDPATGLKWLVEVSDHAHAFLYTETVKVGNLSQRVILADWTYQSYYDRNSPSGPYSKTGKVSGPFNLAEDCYATRYDETGHLYRQNLAPDHD